MKSFSLQITNLEEVASLEDPPDAAVHDLTNLFECEICQDTFATKEDHIEHLRYGLENHVSL